MKNSKPQRLKYFVLEGDRSCLAELIQLDLFQTVNIKLESPKRANQKDYWPKSYYLLKIKKKN
jgi:hypothetical protein